jgi:hypothetical protein
MQAFMSLSSIVAENGANPCTVGWSSPPYIIQASDYYLWYKTTCLDVLVKFPSSRIDLSNGFDGLSGLVDRS